MGGILGAPAPSSFAMINDVITYNLQIDLQLQLCKYMEQSHEKANCILLCICGCVWLDYTEVLHFYSAIGVHHCSVPECLGVCVLLCVCVYCVLQSGFHSEPLVLFIA